MSKELADLSLEELWQLFPIFLVEHNTSWNDWYKEEKDNLISILPKNMMNSIYHIGSTAIPSICAKNIIDILIELESDKQMAFVSQQLSSVGYTVMSSEKYRLSLNKGYTKEGFEPKVFHIHLRLAGDNDEIYFRDYLSAHPTIAREYEQLKLDLSKKFIHNREAYTDAKSEFIQKWTAVAKRNNHKT